MRRLFAAEVRRALSRRVVKVAILLGLSSIAVLGVTVFLTVDADTPEENAREFLGDYREQLLEGCQFETDPSGCIERVPTVEQLSEGDGAFLSTDTDTRPHLVEFWPDDEARADGNDESLLMASSIMLLMVAVLLGASLVGGDYASRNLETLLTWEPRRLRFVAMRLAAVAVVVFFLYVAFQVLFSLVLLPSVFVKGTTEGADIAWFRHLVLMVGRTGLLVAGFGVLGASLAFLARSTAGAMGIVLAYLVGVEAILRSFQPEATNWYVISNLVPLLDPSVELDFFTRTAAGSGFLLFMYLVVVMVAAAGVFRARDLG
ncbi:MAG: hypothetical protein R3A49_00445 [Acidimicrobiia bacterium]